MPNAPAGGALAAEWVVPAAQAGDFQARQVGPIPGAAGDPWPVTLRPFYRTYGRTCSVYFDVVTLEQFTARADALTAERERVRRLEARAKGFFDATYQVPSTLTRGKSKVTVRFQAAPNRRIVPVLAVRTVRTAQL